MRPNKISPETVAKWPEYVLQHSDGYSIPKNIALYDMPDEAYADLYGGCRVRKARPKDGSPPYGVPKGMQLWVRFDTTTREVVDYILVDARLQLMVDASFDLTEIINLPPSLWSHTMKNRCPGAMPSVVYSAR